MKLTDLAAPSTKQFLQQQLEQQPRLIPLQLTNCELLEGCVPNRAAVVFYRKAHQYVVYLDRHVRYFGDNETMKALCENLHLVFPSAEAMWRFFSDLVPELSPVADTPATTGDTAAADDERDTGDVIDMTALTVPPKKTKATPDYTAIKRMLEKRIMGQDEAVAAIAYSVCLHLKKKNATKPLSIVCYGPSGTGKTESAKALPPILSKHSANRYTDILIDFNTYTEAHSVYRLIGSPPSFVGYDDRPVFEAVTDNPYTVFLCDEIEKAHPEVLKVFMTILDEGRCSSRKELSGGSREYDFRHCIFIFTSNLKLGARKRKTGFAPLDSVEDIRVSDNVIEVDFKKTAVPEESEAQLTKRIYKNTEAARKAFMDTGVLPEICSRFSCFVEFKPLTDEAKIRILCKQVIETALEYGVRLSYVAPSIMQELINESVTEDALTVRSFRAVIEGHLAASFADAGAAYDSQNVRLTGTLNAPEIAPA